MALDNEFREMVDSVRELLTDEIAFIAEDVLNRIAMLVGILDKTDSSEAEPATVAAYREDLDIFKSKAQSIRAITGASTGTTGPLVSEEELQEASI